MRKISNRILSVTIKRMIDESPDSSYLGEYSNKADTEFAIDRKHSLDCPVNTGKAGLLWYTSSSGRIELQMTWEQAESVSHSGQCDSDVSELSRVPEIKAQLDKIDPAILAGELKEHGAWSADELADHAQNLQRILWLAGGDIRDNDGCDCGERGDMGRNEFRYFNPATVEPFNPLAHWIPTGIKDKQAYWREAMRKNARQDYERMESLNAGHWAYIGIRAEAEISLATQVNKGCVGGHEVFSHSTQHITSGGLWGIESDSDKAHFESVEKEELSDLRGNLKMLGFSSRAISMAFKNVERKEA